MNDARDETGISEGSCLLFYSLLSCRKTLPPEDFATEYSSVHDFLRSSGLSATGPFITVLHERFGQGRALFLDLEMLVPLPGEMSLPAPYSFVPRLKIGNAVSIRYEGPLSGLRSCYHRLYRYLRERDLEPQDCIYHVCSGDGALPLRVDLLSIDVYITVKRRHP